MRCSGRVDISLSQADLNRVLGKLPHQGLAYSQGVFLIEQALPIGASATCFAVAYQMDEEIHIAVPFDQIRGTGLGIFASALAKTFWGTFSSKLQKGIDSTLKRHGLSREAVRVTQATLQDGRKGGLIRVSLPHFNTWLGRKKTTQGLSFRIANVAFNPGSLHVSLDALMP